MVNGAILAILSTRCLLLGTPAIAPSANDAAAPATVATQAPAKASVADLEWMSGVWKGKGFGGSVEEHWTAPAGGSMLGMFRLVTDQDRATVFELLLIEQEGQEVIYRFRHFGPGHEPWEPPDKPLVFQLIKSGDNEAVFESTVQTNPKRLTYRRQDDALSIRFQGEKDGKLTDGFSLTLKDATAGGQANMDD